MRITIATNAIPMRFIETLIEAQIPPDAIARIMSKAEVLTVKNHTKLIEPHEVCDTAYFILKGGFVCRYIDEDLDIERTINFYLEDLHPFMACIDSFFSGTKTKCELRAILPSEVLVLPKADIEAEIKHDFQLFQFYHVLVTTALQEENEFKLKIISYTSEQLYQYLIETYPMIIQRIPSRYIAEFMGISQEWLSKLKHRLYIS